MIIADTKFEFGLDADGTLVLMDEVLTPDSSRYWPWKATRQPWPLAPTRPATTSSSCATGWSTAKVNGKPWDKTAPAPRLPQEVIANTAAKYREALQRLTA